VGWVAQLVKIVELRIKRVGGPGLKSWQGEKTNDNIVILTTNNLPFKKKRKRLEA
jgi:hypothetical protein